VGNLLRRDDGVGVLAARMMAALPPLADVEVLDAGTMGVDVAMAMEHREKVVIVDAMDAGIEAGGVLRLRPEDLAPRPEGAGGIQESALNGKDRAPALPAGGEALLGRSARIGFSSRGKSPRLSLHELHLLDALDELRMLGTTPDHVIVFAVQAADVSSGIALSPAVRRALWRIPALVLAELGGPDAAPPFGPEWHALVRSPMELIQ